MPSSITETKSESADFFTKPAETDRLQDFENRNNTTDYADLMLSLTKKISSNQTEIPHFFTHLSDR